MSDIIMHIVPSGAVAHHDHLTTCVYCVEDELDTCPKCGATTLVVRAADTELGDPTDEGWLVECPTPTCDHSLIVADAMFDTQPPKETSHAI